LKALRIELAEFRNVEGAEVSQLALLGRSTGSYIPQRHPLFEIPACD
jgi:hypothetical protein